MVKMIFAFAKSFQVCGSECASIQEQSHEIKQNFVGKSYMY